jgi:uncharacterized protein
LHLLPENGRKQQRIGIFYRSNALTYSGMNYFAAKAYLLNRLDRELSPQLTYHGLHHTLDVLAYSIDIAKWEGIDREDLLLLCTAAVFHDAGFLISWQNHEQHGCKLVHQVLPDFGYSHPAIQRISGMILATAVPQNPQNHLEKILCDADLDYLGRPEFYRIGRTLFQEFRLQGIIRSENEWNDLQIRFLESHQYFTKTTIHRRQALKEEHLQQLKSLRVI